MAAVPAPGQAYEVGAAAPLLDTLKNVMVVGDKGFDSDTLRQHLLAQGCDLIVPKEASAKVYLPSDPGGITVAAIPPGSGNGKNKPVVSPGAGSTTGYFADKPSAC